MHRRRLTTRLSTDITDRHPRLTLARFVCVENAGRSQIASAIAETQVQIRNRTNIEVISSGTDTDEEIYPAVVGVMGEASDAANSPATVSGYPRLGPL
ncbi:arsenate reductase/protein-tyrosine-phosphatase family protein [Halobaculum gomorrense]|uniref:arsenate reductase/protein-tyrosine-phosphatase family protein n=1 Tax=Halobaculum gomorrense TaxID=43928 RepID=UPI00373FC682